MIQDLSSMKLSHSDEDTYEYEAFNWTPKGIVNLPIPDGYDSYTVDHIPFTVSGKKVFRALSLDDLGALFWLTARQQFSEKHTIRHYQRLRPCFTNESVHPIHILTWNQRTYLLQRYNPFKHTLEEIQTLHPKALRGVYRALDIQDGELIMLAAEPGKSPLLSTKNHSHLSRDSHIIHGYLSLAAEMMGLNFTSIAMSGDPIIAQLDNSRRLYGVGVNLVGAK